MSVRGLPLLVLLGGCLDAPPSSIRDGGPLDDSGAPGERIACEQPADCPELGGRARECHCGSCAVRDEDCVPGALRWLRGDGKEGACAPAPVDVALGVQSTCVLWSDGRVSCWGGDCYGEVGDGGASDCTDGPQFSPLPRLVLSSSGGPPFEGAVAVAAGSQHACALRGDGSVWCWGSNSFGKLGDGSAEVNATTPVAVVTDPDVPLSGITAIAAGSDHTCALDGGGFVHCWGNNTYRQLGVTTVSDRDVATRSTIGSGFVGIAAGGWHSCVSRPGATTDELFCWGRGSYGQLGNGSVHEPGSNAALLVVYEGDIATSLIPTVYGLGENFSCSATADLAAWCWGSNAGYALGDVAVPESDSGMDALGARRTAPVLASQPTHLAGGNAFACMRLEDGSVTCWGNNTVGQVGVGQATALPQGPTVLGLETVDIEVGGDHACAITPEGTVLCWGGNVQGQLGTGDAEPRAQPTEVTALCQ